MNLLLYGESTVERVFIKIWDEHILQKQSELWKVSDLYTQKLLIGEKKNYS